MSESRLNHLEELSGSDYKIAEDQPDIEGWKIVDNAGQQIGKVKDFLFDKQALKVRYLITNLKDGDLFDDDRKVLIPIGKAQIVKDDDRVLIPNITREQITSLPKYKKIDEMTSSDEQAVRRAFGAGGAAAATGEYNRETFYDHEDFDEDRFYDSKHNTQNRGQEDAHKKVNVVEENMEVGVRKEQTGGARVKSRLVERPVEERVNLKKENVHVNRERVDRPADGRDLENFKEGTVEMRETEEVPVVNKEARVVEEVSLDKDVENREEVIKDKVRHTEVDVENLDRDKDRSKNQDSDRLADSGRMTDSDRDQRNRNRERDMDIENFDGDRDKPGKSGNKRGDLHDDDVRNRNT